MKMQSPQGKKYLCVNTNTAQDNKTNIQRLEMTCLAQLFRYFHKVWPSDNPDCHNLPAECDVLMKPYY